ncbi:hypothetical protein BST81_18550 [Leptolyngbya sp. 'hensonii']|nr:hypothetical protein BST81_18550 [Leptolyngbya sp. 'hensonii']
MHVSKPASNKSFASLETQGWYRPTFSSEHGVYVMLLIAYLTGIAAAQGFNGATLLALVCAFLGFQAEHPIALQIKQRKTLKLRFLIWGGIYGGIALVIALYLYLQAPIVGWLYAGAIAALIIDAIAVFYRQQRSILNEGMTFAAVCLSAPFAYIATTGTLSLSIIGLWLLNTLFFSSAIFTLKFRKLKSHPVQPGAIYHLIATLIVIALYKFNVLPLFVVLAFAIALIRYGVILWQREWFCETAIHNVAIIETTAAILFAAVVCYGQLALYYY